MRRLILFVLILSSFHSYSQDTLYFRKGDSLLVNVKEVGSQTISYEKFDYQDGPIFRVFNTEVKKIHFKSGMKKFFSENVVKDTRISTISGDTKAIDPSKELRESELKEIAVLTYRDGEMDAKNLYKGWKSAAIGSYFSGLILFYGLPVPVISSVIPPANVNLYAQKENAMKYNNEYARGFKTRAHLMKAGKVWANYGYGVGTTLGVTLGLIVLFIASVN